jgi:aspartate aminotransferase-like enzyme
MGALLDNIDPNGLEEFSVVFTDRSLNHMSASFQEVMNDISNMLKEVYSSDAVVIVPGGGTFGMEAVARQFGRDAKVLVARNGWFSYRWSQIFECNNLAQSVEVMKARREKKFRAISFPSSPNRSIGKKNKILFT